MSALHELKGEELDLILHSPGGSLEVSEQVVTYLRSKYRHIRAVVPQNAMSAATMIACACDGIVMGKHSALGPIDPQITVPHKQDLSQPLLRPCSTKSRKQRMRSVRIRGRPRFG